ncbi:hypothetical protein KAR91_67640, partial [Candidatus Pacearchaeota archaeon]|nr:hypothetical protein [Candidatus Pacearchaeota archaeon]
AQVYEPEDKVYGGEHRVEGIYYIGDSLIDGAYQGILTDTNYVVDKINAATNGAVINPTDSVTFNPDISSTPTTEYTIWGDKLTGLLSYMRANASGQNYINATIDIPFVNTTTTTIYPGTPLSGKSIDFSFGRGLPDVDIATCLDAGLASSFAGVSRDTVLQDSIGTILTLNFLNYNTSAWSLGDEIWVDCDSTLTNISPVSPYYSLFVGYVGLVGVNGIIAVNAKAYTGNDTDVAINGILNGIILDKQSISIVQETGGVYLETDNELRDTIDLPYMYQKNIFQLNTTTSTGTGGKARVALSYGTEKVPQVNYVYIDHNGGSPQLAANTTAFPAEQIRHTELSLYDSATTADRGVSHIQRWNNAVDGTTTDGWVSKSAKNARLDGTRWYSGVVQTVDLVTDAGSVDSLNIYTAAGVVPQYNFQNFDTQTEKKYYWFNAPGGSKWVDDLNEVDSTADGSDMRGNNSRYSIDVFGVQCSDTFPDYFVVASSSQEYVSDAGVLEGAYSISSVPNYLRFTAFRIARLDLRYNTGSNGTITNLQGAGGFIDNRGQPLGVGAGASAGEGGTSYPVSDAVFSILNNADPTKIMNFDLSNVTTGTTRTLTVPDVSDTIATLTTSINSIVEDVTPELGGNLETNSNDIIFSTSDLISNSSVSNFIRIEESGDSKMRISSSNQILISSSSDNVSIFGGGEFASIEGSDELRLKGDTINIGITAIDFITITTDSSLFYNDIKTDGTITSDTTKSNVITANDNDSIVIDSHASMKSASSMPFLITYAASVTMDGDNGQNQYVTLTGDITISLQDMRRGSTYTLKVTQDATGGHTPTFSTGFDYLANESATFSETLSDINLVVIYVDEAGKGLYSLSTYTP